MHHSCVKSKLVDTINPNKINKNVGSRGNDSPICPKPRRVGSALPAQFLNHPSICCNHHHINSDARSGILDIIGEKRKEECNKCSLCESPPRRTDNPLIHDLHFLQIHPHIQFFPSFTPT